MTGGSGFIGSKLNSFYPNKFITKDPKTNCKFRNGFSISKEYIKKYNIKTVLLLGGLTKFPFIRSHSDEAFDVNVNKIKNTINCLIDKNIHLVFISSESVFSGEKGLYLEEDSPNPIFIYGIMKFLIEKYIEENFNKDKYTIIRTTKVYDRNPVNSSLFKDTISFLGRKIPYKVITDIYTNPIEISTLSKFIYQVCERKISGKFHLGGLDVVSRKDIIDNINNKIKEFSLDKLKIDAEFTQSKNLESFRYLPKNTSLNSDYTRNILNFAQDSILADIESHIKEKYLLLKNND